MTVERAVLISPTFDCSKVASSLLACSARWGIEVVWIKCFDEALVRLDDVRIMRLENTASSYRKET
jgi:hypothetical protein